MHKVIFDYYVNEFGTYSFILKLVFNGVIRGKRENLVTLTHSAQKKHAFKGGNIRNPKNKEITV